jgi:GxxExxY protein
MNVQKPEFMKEKHEIGTNFTVDEDWDALTTRIMDACFAVHREIGPGLREEIYQACLLKEFELREINFNCQVKVPLQYKGHSLDKNLILDLLVEDRIILELKAVTEINELFQAQLLTYLKLTNRKIGYIVNFNVPLLKKGIKRMKNGY